MYAFTSPEAVLGEVGTVLPLAFPIPFDGFLSIEQVLLEMVLLFVLSFLIGSIPWGLVISRLLFKKDVRNEGSGNIGATNVMRTVGKKGGALAFLLDGGKGVLCGFFGYLLARSMLASGYANGCVALCVAFLGCVWGHIFSPWLGFKGGKGISVAFGCLFFVFGIAGALIELAAFIIVVAIWRHVSLGSITAAFIAPFMAIWLYWGNWLGMALVVIAAITIIWAHRSNIVRLMQGTESRIGSKKKDRACTGAVDGDIDPDPEAKTFTETIIAEKIPAEEIE